MSAIGGMRGRGVFDAVAVAGALRGAAAPRPRNAAAVPVAPFLFGLPELVALAIGGVLVGLALMLTGATVGVLSGGPPLRRALRQLAIGLGAAAVTYCLGLLFGTATG